MPSLDVIQTAYKLLIMYGIFRWSKEDGFSMTAHDGAQFKAFTIQAVKDKRLIKGRWAERTWTGFVTLSRLVRTFLDHNVRYGTWSFDVVIAKCLSVVLVSSLGCRGGDVARSTKYTGAEYLHYKHVVLYLQQAGAAAAGGAEYPQFQDLRAVITLDYCKGHKDEHNVSQVKYLRPLDMQSIHVCPIALLLIHALRHGLVHGTTIGEVLSRAAARPDLHVEWKYPERPVLASFAKGPIRCNLDAIAGQEQVCSTVKLMGLVSGMLSRAYTHSLRIGAIRDYAHLSKTAQASLPSTDDIRKFAGHNITSMHKGVTDHYVGDIAQYSYNARAEDGGVHHGREPKFAVGGGGEAYWGMIQKPLQAGEIQAYIDEHKPGREPASLTRAERRTMGDHVRRKRAEALDREPPTPAAARHHRTVPNMGVAAPEVPPPPPLPSPAQHTRASTSGEGMAAATGGAEYSNFLSNIDPALLNEDDLASLDVADTDVDALQAVIFPDAAAGAQGVAQGAEEGNDEVEDQAVLFEGMPLDPAVAVVQDSDFKETTRVLLGQEEEKVEDGQTADKDSHTGWVDGYAKYNIVNNAKFANAWKKFSDEQVGFEDSIGYHSVRGGSRDEPTPYIFHCRRTEGCDYTTIKKALLDQHELSCSTRAVEANAQEKDIPPDADVLKCTHPGCTFQTSSGQKLLNRHVRQKHEFSPQECDDCDDGIMYQTSGSLEYHKTTVHSGRWPSKCLVPACPDTREWGSHASMVNHLRKNHGLLTAEAYNPYLPPYPEKKQWIKQECVVATCTNKTLFTKKDGMIQHVKTKHEMDYKQAKELVDREAHMETVIPKARILAPRHQNKRPSNQQASPVAALGKENDPPVALDGVQEQLGEHGIGGRAEPKLKKPRVRKS